MATGAYTGYQSSMVSSRIKASIFEQAMLWASVDAPILLLTMLLWALVKALIAILLRDPVKTLILLLSMLLWASVQTLILLSTML